MKMQMQGYGQNCEDVFYSYSCHEMFLPFMPFGWWQLCRARILRPSQRFV